MIPRFLTFGWLAPDGEAFYQYYRYSGINHETLIKAIAITNFQKFGVDKYTELLGLFREYGAARFALHKGWVRWGFNFYIKNQMSFVIEGGSDIINNEEIKSILKEILRAKLETQAVYHVVVDTLELGSFRKLQDSQILTTVEFLS
jgi:hypothetical protein